MNHIKLVLVDIDGTLLNDNGIVTPKTIAAIQKLKEKHILFGIATGRTPYAVKHLIKDWKIDEYVDIIMGFNGGCYLDMRTQNMSSCYLLDGKYIPMIFNEFKEFHFNAGIYDQESFHVLKEDDFAKFHRPSEPLVILSCFNSVFSESILWFRSHHFFD